MSTTRAAPATRAPATAAPSANGSTPTDEQGAADRAAPLDALLADAALGPIRRWLPGSAGIQLAAHLAARPAAR